MKYTEARTICLDTPPNRQLPFPDMNKKFLTICLNPTIQKTLVFDGFGIDQVNRAGITRTDASGKGVNVTRVLNQLGANAVHMTHAGGPDSGWFLGMCTADGLDVRWVDSFSPVRFCTTVIDTLAGTATELVEESLPVQPGTEERIRALFDSLVGDFDVVTLSGTKASGYSPSIIPAMVKHATAKGVMTILDIRGEDLMASLPFGPSVVKPNLAEFLSTFPFAGRNDPGRLRLHVRDCAREWKGKFGTELVVTRGGESVWFNENGDAVEEEVPRVQALNPTGSGDSFAAGLSYALASGGSLREAVREGIRLGGINATRLKPGSIEPD